MEDSQEYNRCEVGVVEADADSGGRATQRFPWDESKGKTSQSDNRLTSSEVKPDERATESSSTHTLTNEEKDKLMKSLGKMTSWLASKSCQAVPVPEDLRKLVEKLPGSKELFKNGKPPLVLARLVDLGAVSEDFQRDYLTLVSHTLSSKRPID
jgi:hypothetical protein